MLVQRQRQCSLLCRASRSEDLWSSPQLRSITGTTGYSVWLQGGVVLVILAAIDAAYSGDWSRIGVISTAQEQQLQGALGALGAFHIICAVVAARSAWAKGLPVLPSAAKVLAVGFLAMVEVLAKDKATDS